MRGRRYLPTARRNVGADGAIFREGGYGRIMDKRVRDTFRAIYAGDVESVNRLAERHGVTHPIVRKYAFRRADLEEGTIYWREYNDFIVRLTRNRNRFVLNPPPREAIVFEDARYWLVRLPLRARGSASTVTPEQASGAPSKEEE